MPNKKLSPRDKTIIYSLHLEGKSQLKIANLFGVSQSSISGIIKEMRFQSQLNQANMRYAEQLMHNTNSNKDTEEHNKMISIRRLPSNKDKK